MMSEKPKRKHYARIKKRMSAKGTTAAMNKHSGRSFESSARKQAKTTQNTRIWNSRKPELIYGPYLADNYIPPVMREELKLLGVHYRVGRETPYTPVIAMDPYKVSIQELHDHGIVIEMNRQDRHKWRMSGYDLLHILENKLIEDSPINDRSYDAFRNYMESQDPDFTEKYFVYKELKESGAIVMDATMHGYDFIVYEEPSENFIEELQKIPIARIGAKKNLPDRRKTSFASINGIGLITVMTADNEYTVKEVIKAQHIAQKNKIKYLMTNANGYHDEDGHLVIPIENSTKSYDTRHMRKNLTTARGNETIIGTGE